MELNDRMRRAEDYVFGLMDAHERERAERDMEADAEFRACVLSLAERLRKVNRDKQPALSDAAWGDVARRIAGMPQMAATGAAAPATATMMSAPDPDRKGFLGIKRPSAHQFGGWRGTVVAMCLIAAMAVGYMAGQTAAPAPRPVVVAVLADESGTAGAIVEAYPAGAIRVLPLAAFEVPRAKVLQVWSTPEGAARPVPLGTLPRARETRLVGPDLPAPRHGQPYSITLEDAPGSSTGLPQGPVLVSGTAVAPPR